MSNYAVMPKADYIAACNTIREKTGDTEVIKSGELTEKINDAYNAGAVSVLQNSKYMHPTVSGEVIRIDDMSAVPHKVSVTKRSDTVEDLDVVKIKMFGKNLFKIYRDEIVSNAWVTPDTPITPNGNRVYKGISYSNYQISGNVSDLAIGDTVSFVNNTDNIQYGIGFDVKVAPNTTYTLSIGKNVNGKIAINYYDKTGKYLKADTNQYTFTTNAKTEWIIIVLCVAERGAVASFTDIQLELGSTATEYEPYTLEEVGDTFDSIPNTITLIPDTSGVVLDCQYLRDIDKYIDKYFKE